jgi:hypothetical protein
MTIHYEVARLGSAATPEEDRRKGAHMALPHRRIRDATAARNLARAGFAQVAERAVWRPAPESLVEPDPPLAL